MTKKILLAKVVGAFGIKGEVKIESYCQNPQDIEKYDLFDAKEEKVKLRISNKNKAVIGHTSNGGGVLIVKINDINNRTDAEKLKGKEFFSCRADFKKTKKNEFYYSDLIGLDAVNKDFKKVGNVTAVNNYGGGTMIEINFIDKDTKKYYDEIDNFPFKNEIFPEINLEKNYILIDYQK